MKFFRIVRYGMTLIVLCMGLSAGLLAMGKTPPADGTDSASAPSTTNSPNMPPPANPYYNSPSNTGTSGAPNQGSMPIGKGAVGTPTPVTNRETPGTSGSATPSGGSSAATGVGQYGGSPAGPSGSR